MVRIEIPITMERLLSMGEKIMESMAFVCYTHYYVEYHIFVEYDTIPA